MHDRQDQGTDLEKQINRRGFLGTGTAAVAVATAASLRNGYEAGAQDATKATAIPGCPSGSWARPASRCRC